MYVFVGGDVVRGSFESFIPNLLWSGSDCFFCHAAEKKQKSEDVFESNLKAFVFSLTECRKGLLPEGGAYITSHEKVQIIIVAWKKEVNKQFTVSETTVYVVFWNILQVFTCI